MFYGLGADGTVGANKNSVKIIAEDAALFAQGYFVYDSHKSGAQTVSHLRFGPRPIEAPYLIQRANFVACHKFDFVERIDVLRLAAPGATFLLNSPYGPDEVWDHLPHAMQKRMIALKLRFFVIDASKVAQDVGLRGRTNTVLQTCFFAISGVMPQDAGDQPHQGVDPQDLRPPRRGCGAPQFPGCRRHIGAALRGSSPAATPPVASSVPRSCPRTRLYSCARSPQG